MSKPLDQLDASQAGVSQAELEAAFLELPELEKELATEEANLETALAAKVKARTAFGKAKERVQAALTTRDPVFEECQRAAWIVRNADPDQPPPPTGIVPPDIRAMRVS